MQENIKAAVYGAFVADALSLGPHWVYNTNVIDKKFGVVDRFLDPLTSFHKGKHAGDLTHYGDQMLALLDSLHAHAGFQIEQFAADWRRFMDTYDGYFDQATKATLQNMSDGREYPDCGSTSDDLGGAARIAPLIAVYHGERQQLGEAVRAQTTMTHNHPGVIDSADFFARVVVNVLDGMKPTEAFDPAAAQFPEDNGLREGLSAGRESRASDTRAAIADFGQMCAVEAAFPGTIHLIAKYEDNFKQAMVANVMAGGDSAARGILAGMVLGAFHGMAGIPEPWVSGLKCKDRIDAFWAGLDD